MLHNVVAIDLIAKQQIAVWLRFGQEAQA